MDDGGENFSSGFITCYADPTMSNRTKRILLRIAVIVTAPFLLFTALWVLFFFNLINPMQEAFITEFEIENNTQQTVWVTPVGTFNEGGKSALPQFMSRFPSIPLGRSRDLMIEPGARRHIYYDWDDINFSEIAVRDSSGVLRNLVIDDSPPAEDYYANQEDLYRIENLESLPKASPEIQSAVAPPPPRVVFWTFARGGLIAPFLFTYLRRRQRELTDTPPVNVASGSSHSGNPGS